MGEFFYKNFKEKKEIKKNLTQKIIKNIKNLNQNPINYNKPTFNA